MTITFVGFFFLLLVIQRKVEWLLLWLVLLLFFFQQNFKAFITQEPPVAEQWNFQGR